MAKHTLTVEPKPDPASATPSAARRRVLVPVALVLVGVLVLLYPVVATQWNNLRQRAVAEEYSRIERETPAHVLGAQWESAHRYNDTRAQGPILDPWLARVSQDNVDYQEYLRELNGQDAMGRILIPSIRVDLPVFHGTAEAVLQRGVGHLYGSDLPVGGTGTHSALTGHSGLSNATLFDDLPDVRVGDAIYIAVAGHRLKYEVDQVKTVLPDQTDDLAVNPTLDQLTLITCTPYGINTHRLLVRAHQVPLDPEDAAVFDDGVGVPWQWWMWALLAGAAVVLAGITWWAVWSLRAGRCAVPAAALDGAGDGAAGASATEELST